MTDTEASADSAAKRWQPISAIDRRVLGVLMEKAKTTPEVYPMTINALRSGANQKSNRYPLMELEPEPIEESLTRLRHLGAVGLVQGGGRVDRYRHHFYEWLGVDKPESAVMTELLLRGAQTEGELRARASRMEPIPDLAALRPVLDRLKQKGLILSLSPEGRGHVLTHALYLPQELERLRREFAAAPANEFADAPPARPSAAPEPAPRPPAAAFAATAAPMAAAPPAPAGDYRLLEARVQTLEAQRKELESVLDELRGKLDQCRDELHELKAALGA